MVGLHVIEYLLRVPCVWGFLWGFQWGFLWVWDGYGDWNAIPTAALYIRLGAFVCVIARKDTGHRRIQLGSFVYNLHCYYDHVHRRRLSMWKNFLAVFVSLRLIAVAHTLLQRWRSGLVVPSMYTVGHKMCQQTLVHIVSKYWPILKIISRPHFAVNVQ